MYDLLVANFGSDYFVSEDEFTTVADTEDYSLPSDFYKLLGVDIDDGSGYKHTLRKFSFPERNSRQRQGGYFSSSNSNLRYRLIGDNIRFSPVPNSAETITLHYIPRVTKLVDDTDEVDSTILDGWLEYVVIDAAIKIKIKEESPINELMMQKQSIKDRIELMSDDRDAGEPDVVVDVYGHNRRYGRY